MVELIAVRVRQGRRRMAAVAVAVASVAALATPTPAAAAGPHLYTAAIDYAHDLGANYNYVDYNSTLQQAVGLDSDAFQFGRFNSSTPADARADINTLAVVVSSFMNYDPRTSYGLDQDYGMIASLDENLGRVSGVEQLDAAKNVFYRLQPTEVSTNDELRRHLLANCRTCIRVAVLTAAVTGGAITTLALNGTNLTAIAKGGVALGVAALIAVALNVVTQWDNENLYAVTQANLQLIRSYTNTLIQALHAAVNNNTDRIARQGVVIADLENQLSALRREFQTTERGSIGLRESGEGVGNGFTGQLWGTAHP